MWLNSFFKTLVDHEVTVELKNDIQIRGTLKSVDQYLNIKLDDIQVVEELKYPHLVSTKGECDQTFVPDILEQSNANALLF
jgi:small nuclear ribonucleoprotein (snRNP)-like protein